MTLPPLRVVCDHDGCTASLEALYSREGALTLAEQKGWAVANFWHYCPEHYDDLARHHH